MLVLGGSNARDFRGRLRVSELFEPRARRFVSAPPLREPLFKIPDAAVRLPGGDVVVAGGGSLQRFTPRLGFERVGTLGVPRAFSTVTPLPGGAVLVVGGYDDAIEPSRASFVCGAP